MIGHNNNHFYAVVSTAIFNNGPSDEDIHVTDVSIVENGVTPITAIPGGTGSNIVGTATVTLHFALDNGDSMDIPVILNGLAYNETLDDSNSSFIFYIGSDVVTVTINGGVDRPNSALIFSPALTVSFSAVPIS